MTTLESAVGDLKKGKPFWPHLALTFPDRESPLADLRSAPKAEIMSFMDKFFAVMGKNCENFATLTGYWDTNIPLKTLGERAEDLCKLFKK